MRRYLLFAILASVAVCGAFLLTGTFWSRAQVQHQACPSGVSVVQVDTSARVLSLCRIGQEEASFHVALGRGGVDKRAEGDGRTPKGRYSLGRSRSSNRYYLFIPVGYPTPEQARLGFTGSAIGVHGPHQMFAWLGNITAWPNWTQGCVALPTRAEIEKIATWVAENRVSEIIIL